MTDLNLFYYTVPPTGEAFTTLLQDKNVKIVRIVSSNNIEPTEYHQEEDEWVVLLEGEAEMEIDGKRRTLKRGDTLFLPAHTPHTVLRTARGTLWLAVHIYPAEKS
ncbi:cupin domain-containing protein [Nitratifractor salsuginis]|uniref:Cupin 2 conserved barrel domain protein n=1 Tax=Nitratifractor salsuginis (strain DSM 16511 / JCM 12458 / E9I37-1) TaxID=749222 RepID=E6X248_NITSE|nr:cupin domain-containing protein [Nitratifractor salsuginis]ADV47117.1 Cupin 2 conserved barrel domain protein [Nitratifractor salsuginis DSM 16511]